MTAEVQRLTRIEPAVFGQFDPWMTQRIRQLSFSTMASGLFTCTACGEVEGDYILAYKGETFRFDTMTTYAILQFMLEKKSAL
ncbi:MAG: hypothetical protein AAFY20_26530 [Cyanobacteria bacterium J06639_14]